MEFFRIQPKLSQLKGDRLDADELQQEGGEHIADEQDTGRVEGDGVVGEAGGDGEDGEEGLDE